MNRFSFSVERKTDSPNRVTLNAVVAGRSYTNREVTVNGIYFEEAMELIRDVILGKDEDQ